MNCGSQAFVIFVEVDKNGDMVEPAHSPGGMCKGCGQFIEDGWTFESNG